MWDLFKCLDSSSTSRFSRTSRMIEMKLKFDIFFLFWVSLFVLGQDQRVESITHSCYSRPQRVSFLWNLNFLWVFPDHARLWLSISERQQIRKDQKKRRNGSPRVSDTISELFLSAARTGRPAEKKSIPAHVGQIQRELHLPRIWWFTARTNLKNETPLISSLVYACLFYVFLSEWGGGD